MSTNVAFDRRKKVGLQLDKVMISQVQLDSNTFEAHFCDAILVKYSVHFESIHEQKVYLTFYLAPFY